MKHFGMTYSEVLWGHSWVNLVMLMEPFADTGAGKADEVKELTPAEMFKLFNPNGS